MRAKKGELALEEVIRWSLVLLLGLSVIGIIGYNFFPKSVQYLKEVIGVGMGWMTKEEFKPYQLQFSDEETKVDNSVRALIYSIEKTSNPLGTGKLPAGIPSCDEVKQTQQMPQSDKICCETQ